MLDKLLNYGRALPYMRKDWWDLYNASKSSGGARVAYNWKNRKCGADQFVVNICKKIPI